MVFSSAIFLLFFLPAVFIINWLVKKKYSNYILLAASLVFYAWGEPVLVLFLLASIVINWVVGYIISTEKGSLRILTLIAGIAIDLFFLGYYKYAGFFAKTVNAVFKKDIVPVLNIALPIGISFFTFQAISYIIDVYRGKAEGSARIVNVALYISFFPQLIAGPIVKYRDINKQIEDRTVEWSGVSNGFKRFIYGLGKKVLIANVLGLCVDTIYAYDIAVLDAKTAWIGALAYTLQIYYDFSGYSDMAIGLGKMFGFKIPENFNYPYLSKSVSEFWRRWHISLGSWFREYVYIPLGGSRQGILMTCINLVFIFLLTGIWHGADFSFVIWGLYHGFFVIAERLGLKKLLSKTRIISVIYTWLVVNCGWVLFRADDTAAGIGYLEKMILPWKYQDIHIPSWEYMDLKTGLVFIAGLAGIGFMTLLPKRIKNKWSGSIAEAVYCTGILILSLAAIASSTYNPFIYFQF